MEKPENKWVLHCLFTAIASKRIAEKLGLDFYMTDEQISEDEKQFIKEGCIVEGLVVLSADVAIYEYEKGSVFNEKNNLALLRYTIEEGDAERLRAALSKEAVYISDTTQKTYYGADQIIQRFHKLKDNKFFASYQKPVDTYFTTKELKEMKKKFESGQAVILPTGAIDVLKLLTCASICYQHIYENMVEDMAKSEDIGKLFMKSPMPQGTTLRTGLYELMQSDINCNKITGIDDILNAMPSFKEYLKKDAEAKLLELRGCLKYKEKQND